MTIMNSKILYRVKEDNNATKAQLNALQRFGRHIQLGLPLTAKDLCATMDKFQLAELVLLMFKDKMIEIDIVNAQTIDYVEETEAN